MHKGKNKIKKNKNDEDYDVLSFSSYESDSKKLKAIGEVESMSRSGVIRMLIRNYKGVKNVK